MYRSPSGLHVEKDMISKILALIMAGSIAAMLMWIGSEVRTYEGWIMIGGTFLSGLYTHWLWGFVTSDEGFGSSIDDILGGLVPPFFGYAFLQ